MKSTKRHEHLKGRYIKALFRDNKDNDIGLCTNFCGRSMLRKNMINEDEGWLTPKQIKEYAKVTVSMDTPKRISSREEYALYVHYLRIALHGMETRLNWIDEMDTDSKGTRKNSDQGIRHVEAKPQQRRTQ